MTAPPSRHLIQIRPRQRRLVPMLGLVFAALALSACVETAGQTQVASIEGPVVAVITAKPDDENVAPGPKAVGLVEAVGLFDRVCASHYPDLKASEAEIRKLPFRQATTGTWFHQQLDLSIKLIPDRRACSMVFGSREDPLQLGLAIGVTASSTQKVGISTAGQVTTQGPKGSTFEFGPTSRTSNRTYFHAVLFK